MKYYTLGCEEGFNELRFSKVEDWQKYMGYGTLENPIWDKNTQLEYVYGARSKRNKNVDISPICSPCIIFSDRALSIVGDMLNKYGDLLPIATYDNYKFFVCTNIIDALIEEKSTLNWLDKDNGWISSIDSFAINESLVKGQEIFRLPQANYRYTFFSENFKKLITENKLQGVTFLEQIVIN